MEGGTGIKVLWFREWTTTNTALRNTIRPKHASYEMFAPWGNPIKLLLAMERKGQRQVRQKQHRAEQVLALSSAFVNRVP